ncbi:MAG TPA: hypothetical protein VFS18_03260, partial [Actinomycetota bacterium]|nr:hypothetical protein [Actinomycetota bacterium]
DEGLAQYVSEAGDPATVATFDAAVRASGARIPEDYEFFVGGAGPIYVQYQRSMSVVAYFIERWGLLRFQRFYVRLGKASAPGTTRYHVDAALEETIGMDLRALERAWASSIDRL